jgi:acyl-CoA dehydrogenase
MQRVHYDADHRAFAELAGDFADKEVAPHIADWEADGIIPREVFAKAGEVGLLGFAADERFGGVGARDFRYNQILIEAFMDADCGAVGLSFAVHNDICLPYLADLTTSEQQERWLPGFVKGELIAAIG